MRADGTPGHASSSLSKNIVAVGAPVDPGFPNNDDKGAPSSQFITRLQNAGFRRPWLAAFESAGGL